MKTEKKYTRKDLENFAVHCMTKLCTKYPNGEEDMGEITSLELDKIYKIIREMKLNKIKTFDYTPTIQRDDVSNVVVKEFFEGGLDCTETHILEVDWEEPEWPVFTQWLLKTYGEEAKRYESFVITKAI